jgi:RND superfamily putative drug exporter
MDTLFAALGRFTVRYRYLIVVAWIGITISCVFVFPSLSSVTKNSTLSSLLPANAPSIQASNLAGAFQNTRLASTIIVVVRNQGALTLAGQYSIDQLEARVRTLPHVKLVRDLATSPDGAARQALVEADVPQDGSGTAGTLIDEIRAAFRQVNAPTDLTFHLTGQLATTVDAQRALSSSQNVTQVFTELFIVVLLLLAFRALLAPLLTLLPAVLVLAIASPVIAGAVTRLGVPASVTTQYVLIVLILGAGTDYGLFLTFRVREELQIGLDPHAAVVRAVQTVGETLTFSALTVITALSTLLFAQLVLYQSLGPALAIGIVLLLLAELTLLPALLAIAGRAVFWPTTTSIRKTIAPGIWGKLTGGIVRRPRLTFSLGILIFGGLALGSLGTNLVGSGAQTSGPAGADSTVGTTVIAAHYPGATQSPTLALLRFPQSIWEHPDLLVLVHQDLARGPAIHMVLGPLNPDGFTLTSEQLVHLHTLLGPAQALPPIPPANTPVSIQLYNGYRATAAYVSADGYTVQYVLLLNDSSKSLAAQAAIPSLWAAVNHAARVGGASQSGVYSENAIIYDVNQTSQRDLRTIVPFVVLLIAILLALVLRSMIAPLYLVVSVVLSYLAALGVVGLIFVHLAGQEGIYFILPFELFVFLMALGSDYNILVMTRIREEARSQPLREAVPKSIVRTGGTVTTAGVILAGTFAVLTITANNQQTLQFGVGIAVGLLMDTFLIRTLIIPALVVLLGRWNWWPSLLFRRASTKSTPLREYSSKHWHSSPPTLT